MHALLIVETPLFTRQVTALATDEEYRTLQEALVANPAAGDLLPGGGGLRKIRMARPGKGKRGGARVIYYWHEGKGVVFMLLAYARSAKTNLSPGEIRTLRTLIMELKR